MLRFDPMPEILVLLIAATGTAFATGIGALPVSALGSRTERFTPALLGFAIGVMGVAAIGGLVMPAFEEGSAVRHLVA